MKSVNKGAMNDDGANDRQVRAQQMGHMGGRCEFRVRSRWTVWQMEPMGADSSSFLMRLIRY